MLRLPNVEVAARSFEAGYIFTGDTIMFSEWLLSDWKEKGGGGRRGGGGGGSGSDNRVESNPHRETYRATVITNIGQQRYPLIIANIDGNISRWHVL